MKRLDAFNHKLVISCDCSSCYIFHSAVYSSSSSYYYCPAYFLGFYLTYTVLTAIFQVNPG